MKARNVIDVTPAVERWREANPIRLWLDKQPKAEGFARLLRKLAVTRSAIYTWIHGKSLPPADKLLDVCELIGVGYRTYIRWWRKFPNSPAAGPAVAVVEDEECAVP